MNIPIYVVHGVEMSGGNPIPHIELVTFDGDKASAARDIGSYSRNILQMFNIELPPLYLVTDFEYGYEQKDIIGATTDEALASNVAASYMWGEYHQLKYFDEAERTKVQLNNIRKKLTAEELELIRQLKGDL
jgi:hypothetical protein